MFLRFLCLMLVLCVPAICHGDLYSDWIVGRKTSACDSDVGCAETSCGLSDCSCFLDRLGECGLGECGLGECGLGKCGLGKCGSHPMWFSADYLGWFVKGNQIPALVTTSPSGTAQSSAGVLGETTTSVLFGNERIDDEYRSGLRLRGGIWLDSCRNCGIEFSYLSLCNDSNLFFASTDSPLGSGNGLPILARPFFNVVTVLPDSEMVSFPNVVDGAIGVVTSSKLDSGELMLRKGRYDGCNSRCDLLVGYRYLRFDENLTVAENRVVTETGGVLPQNSQIQVFDSFSTNNDFHGGQLGCAWEYSNDCASIEFIAKLAMGGITRKTTINGGTQVSDPGGSVTQSSGGLLALPTNIDTYRSTSFAVLPEFSTNLKLQLTSRSQFTVGYTLMLLNDVARTGREIDSGVNPGYIPGSTLVSNKPRPIFEDNSNEFWVQGLNLGLVITR